MKQFTDWLQARDYVEKIVEERAHEALALSTDELDEEEMEEALDEIVAEFKLKPSPGLMFIEDAEFLSNLLLIAVHGRIKSIFINRLVSKFYPELSPTQPDWFVQRMAAVTDSIV